MTWLSFAPTSPADAAPAPPTAPPSLPTPVPNNNGGNDRPPEVDAGTNSDGDIVVGISNPGSSGGEAPSAPPTYTPACTWTPLRGGDAAPGGGENPLPGGGEQATDSQGRLGWTVICPGEGLEVRWTTPTPDPITLVQPATDRARALLPMPVPVQSPAPDIGSVVNLGLWFSIEDPGVTTARASLAGAWAEATGTFLSVTVDPGDGTGTIPCDGFGEPYVDGSNTFEEGPCGHTYTQPTPDDAPYIVTYTITYDITWATSDGRTGNVGTFDRTIDFPYDVNEIQTVGTGG